MISWRHSQVVVGDLGNDSLLLSLNGKNRKLGVARDASGRLTEERLQSLRGSLREALTALGVHTGARLWCAIPARGVSLRRITLPPGSDADLASVLSLKIESEFPLPPEALAWGASAVPGGRDHLVAALRRELLADFDKLFTEAGLAPAYVLAASVRALSVEPHVLKFALLDVGSEQSEWVVFEDGQPVAARQIACGETELLRAIATPASLSQAEAKERLDRAAGQKGGGEQPVLDLLIPALDPVLSVLRGLNPARPIYVTHSASWAPLLCAALNQGLNVPALCKALPAQSASGALTLENLRPSVASQPERWLAIRLSQEAGSESMLSNRGAWKQCLLPALLLLALIASPWLEPWLFKRSLERRMQAFRADRSRLALIDREHQFLHYLRENQPTFQEALYVIAQSSPGGIRLNGLNMNRRGEVSIRLSLRDAQQVGAFRSKLLASGFFSSATIEEQSLIQGQQMLNVRMTAQWKPLAEREALNLSPPASELEKFLPKTNSPATNAPAKTTDGATNPPAAGPQKA